MKTRSSQFRHHALATAVVLALAGAAAQAQISNATVKGQVSGGAAGTAVTAVNQANGSIWKTSLRADGSYVLTGLAPGQYQVRVGSSAAQTVTLAVGETATLDLNLSGAQIVVVGNAGRKDVKNSEVGTAVSRRLLEGLPQQTHNFLSGADLAPGVAFEIDGSGYTKVQAGAQNFDNVNVFIDGVSQKNNILRGGLAGQDSSRGNPFPQSAIAEYKVISQNYKAEFEQVSSAAIVAVTRSGGNKFGMEAYVDRTGTNWRDKSVFEKEREAAGTPLPASSKLEYGLSAGGALVPNRLHYFVAYDGKDINDSRQVSPRNLDKLPAGQGLVPAIAAGAGSTVDPFREHLVFGKLDAQLGDDQRLSASLRLRRESDRVPEDRNLSAPGNDKNRKNDATHLDLSHEWNVNASLFSELRAGYQNSLWNPKSAKAGPFIKYKVSTASPQLLSASQDVWFDGGSPDAQRREQSAFYIGEDLTWTGLSGHVVKGGVKLKNMKYDLGGTSRGEDIVETLIDTTTGQSYYSGGNCLGTNPVNTGGVQSTDQCRITRALAPVSVKFDNQQLGLYLQDDWSVSKQVELNLGVRWDVESNMLNNDYVTPSDRVTALRGLDGRTVAGITAPSTQTYAQSLAKGGVNIEDYISNGSSRNTYKGALAPRVGASFDLKGDRSTVVFGGWGRAYDRTMANHALDELQKNAQAGGEIWLIRNDFKMPYADQLSIGLRQAIGEWNAEVSLSNLHAKNQFFWFSGNRDPNGGYGNQSAIDPLWGGPNGFGSLILGDFVGENKTNALYAKLEKPYTQASGWSLNVAYTYSDAKTLQKEWNNDIFDWTYGRPGVRGWNPSTLVDKHRLVVAGLSDGLLPWGLQLSGKLTYASGKPRRITSCAAGWSNCVYVEGDAPAFTQVDASLSKALRLADTQFTLRADVFNLLGKTNYGGFDDWGGGPGNPQNSVGGDNANLGKPNSLRGDTRTLRLAMHLKF
jgi:hypothetical protein